MSNHVATITKDEGRCSFSRKALSVFMAVLLAFLMMPMVPAESASAVTSGDAQAAWDQATVEYTVDDVDGVYEVVVGDVLAVESVAELGATEPLQRSEYTVFYLNGNKNLLGKDQTISGQTGDAPKAAANGYYIAIAKGYVDKTKFNDGMNVSAIQAQTPVKVQQFNVVPESIQLSDDVLSIAAADDADEASFTYNGASQNLALYVNGKVLSEDDNYTVVWDKFQGASAPVVTDGVFAVTDAGVYSGTVYGKPGTTVTGSAKFSVEVAKLDLSTAVITAADKQAGTVANLSAVTELKINGEDIAANKGVAAPKPYTYVNAAGVVANTFASMNTIGAYTYKVGSDNQTGEDEANEGNKNVTGEGYVTVNVYTELITDFKYAGTALNSAAGDFATFVKSLGQYFNPAAITVAGEYDACTYEVVNSETGEAYEGDWQSMPAGKYTLTVVANGEPRFAAGGSITDTFTVKDSTVNYNDATVYVYFDGDVVVSGEALPYTGKAYVPTVVATLNGKTLAEGADYTVELQDADENAVEGFTDVAEGYKVVVKFADETEYDTYTVDVEKAKILSVEPTADFFALGTEPTFVGSTNAEFDKGQQFDLAADQISVAYYDVKGNGTEADPYTKGDKRLSAEDMEEAGVYWAEISVLTTAATIQTEAPLPGCAVELKETAGYNDVAADAWYADAVYKAKDNLYMEGVAAGIFAPEQAMTRAEFAQVVANMAGVVKAGIGETYPTQFTDVPADAWFAKAVEWASRYGIVNGTSETTFEPYGTITREQIATMLYRYAGNGAQADLSVLDQFEDAGSISAYAENAMAWAVENGYVNGTSETTVAPAETATRAQIAAIAVRVQPEAIA